MSAPLIETASETVAMDVVDAAALGELCCYLAEWIATAPVPVQQSLRRFGGEQAPEIALETLSRFADLLVRLLPGVGPVPAAAETPLRPGEAVSLAELLETLAAGWPEDEAEAEALAADCRAFAARLAMVPGVSS